MHKFNHFYDALDEHFDAAIQELSDGQKRTHWMWFIFPQLGDLGTSASSRRFGIRDLAHAREYWNDLTLRMAYMTALDTVTEQCLEGAVPALLFSNALDYRKFKSSLTLFFFANPHIPHLKEAVERHGLCLNTLTLLGMVSHSARSSVS